MGNTLGHVVLSMTAMEALEAEKASPPPLTRLTLGRNQIWVTSDDPSLFYEAWIMDVYDELSLRHGDVVLDVGANVGDFTIKASRAVGAEGRVIAIEPNPAWFAILLKNIALNGLTNVSPYRVAVGSSRGLVRMNGNAMADLESSHENVNSYRVECVPIDSFLAERGLPHPSVMKMDIEGAEVVALRGQRFIIELRELVLEVHGPDRFAQISRELLEKGFRLRRYDAHNLARNSSRQILRHLPTFIASEARTRFFGTRRMMQFFLRGKRIVVATPEQSDLNIVHGIRDTSLPMS